MLPVTGSVSFYAYLENSVYIYGGQHVIPTKVVINEGKGYNSSDGVFVAPLTGTYLFLATATAANEPGSADVATMGLVADYHDVSLAAMMEGKVGGQGACQAVVSLLYGQRVWLKAINYSHFDSLTTSFSGVLIHRA